MILFMSGIFWIVSIISEILWRAGRILIFRVI